MNIFKRNKELNFSDEYIESLTKSVTELKSVLDEIGTSLGQQELTNVLASAMKKDSQLFKKYVLTMKDPIFMMKISQKLLSQGCCPLRRTDTLLQYS